MKNRLSVLYIIWIFVSLITLGILIYKFYPVYSENDFPLFTDIMLVVFLPCYFSLVWLLVHIFNVFFRNNMIKIIVSVVVLSTAFGYSLYLMEFSLILRFIASLLGFIISIVYYALTEFIYRKSKLNTDN